MRDLSLMPQIVLARVCAVLTDIDDTLTTDGRLPAAAYGAVEKLAEAGLAIVPITGRPAGWCDMIARLWPVRGVVGENGAFYFSYDAASRKMARVFFADADERRRNRQKLDALRDRILADVPGSAVAADQLYREADLAIDICEDVPALPKAGVERILALFAGAGAVAKLSSIHVNGWFGAYDKLSMTRRFVREVLGRDMDGERERFVFVGDSPNDAPMFGFFPNACGVANVRDLAHSMPSLPAYVTRARGGAGFVEVAEMILEATKAE